MAPPRKVTLAERRARLGTAHRLTPASAAADPVAVTESMLALHATDPATVYLSAAARMTQPDHAALERAQYETGELVRILAMRRTMFVVTAATAPVVQAAVSDTIAAGLLRRYGQMLEQAGVAKDGAAWLSRAGDAAIATLRNRGDLTGAELGRETPLLQTRVSLFQGKAYASNSNVTGWVTTWLAAEGRILRGRPLGSWTSNQYRWRVADPPPEVPGDEGRDAARSELARLWLRSFGPASAADLRWWTGWTAGETRLAIARLAVEPVDLDGLAGIALSEDNEPVPDPGRWAALLPALDPTPMGWTNRDWYLGDHAAQLFDRTGNIGPTVWVDGRVVGGWAQRPDGSIGTALLEDVGTAKREISAAAKAMSEAIGEARVTVRGRIRTPLEASLAAL